MFENQENNLETEKSLTINMKGEKGNLLPHLKGILGGIVVGHYIIFDRIV